MTQTTLAFSAVASLVTASLYLYVGRVLRRREVSPEARLANGMFVLWWQSLGYLGVAGVGIMGLYVAGHLEIWMYQAYVTFVLLILFLALWGLQFYLVYLYTGSKRSFKVLGIFYALLFVATLALIEYVGAPERIVDDGWSIRTEPRAEFGTLFNLGFALLLLGPQLVAAVAYGRLYFKTTDRTQRYRIAMISVSIIVWFGSSIIASAADLSDTLAWRLASRAISILAATGILAAYKPPAWVRKKYGVEGVKEAKAPPT